jgi:IS30 family transposase
MKYSRLSINEREYIAVGIAKGSSYTAIAQQISRSISTVQREAMRHMNTDGFYWACLAHQRAVGKAQKSHRKPHRIVSGGQLEDLIHSKLQVRWSPKQISLWLKETQDISMQASPETIYQYIYMLPRGELKKELIRYLRHKKPNRKPRKALTEARGKIVDMISIVERPEEVADRSVPGHWEGDLIIGKDHKSAIATIVERQTRYVLMVHLKKYDAESVRKAITRRLKSLPVDLVKSVTWDQGKEMAQHAKFTVATGIKVYFCDPASPWQRGTCENTNMLIRGFFPKGTDFNTVSPQKLSWTQNALNERPRETLGFITPKQALNKLLLKT